MKALALAVVVIGCTNDVDPAWQLDHDRVIAARITPPHILTGETATVDALLGHKGAAPEVVLPATAVVDSPTGLDSTLHHDAASGVWSVTAPGDTQLAAARAQLGLEPGAPVPLRLRLTFPGSTLVALKIVWLGDHAENPVIDPVLIDGVDALPEPSLTVAPATRIDLAVNFDTSFDINWLTSCGTMHDFDLATSYLRVEPEDPQTGTLAIVVRDNIGGVDWHLWPITAQ